MRGGLEPPRSAFLLGGLAALESGRDSFLGRQNHKPDPPQFGKAARESGPKLSDPQHEPLALPRTRLDP